MKTHIFITVDTEFSIAGAFGDPVACQPVGAPTALCRQNGESHGVGFILETLNACGLKGTFFVEAMNVHYFGDEPMGRIARDIAARGGDVQLHLHPCWGYFKNPAWADELKVSPPNDDIRRRSPDEIRNLLQEGIDTFSRWGIKPPCALRTGSLIVSRDVYRAMADKGLRYSSNIGVGIFRPQDEDLMRYSGYCEIEGCVELPVLSYRDFGAGGAESLKALTITGSSWSEIEHLLSAAARQKIDYLVILTHPFEFVKNANRDFTALQANTVNKKRFEKLCRFLADRSDQFSVRTFSELPSLPLTQRPSANTLLEVPLPLAVMRRAENFLNEKIAWL